MDDLAAEWLDWYTSIGLKLDLACDEVAGMWLRGDRGSEGFHESVSKALTALTRWEEAVIAYNAFMEDRE